MTGSFPTTRRIELLLRTASGAHYACRSLLDEAREELSGLPQLMPVRDAVSALMECVEQGIDGDEFDTRLAAVLDVLALTTGTARETHLGAA